MLYSGRVSTKPFVEMWKVFTTPHHLDVARRKCSLTAIPQARSLLTASITWMPYSERPLPRSPSPRYKMPKCSSEAHHLDAVLWKGFLETVRGNVESFHGPHHMPLTGSS
eukprot:6462279-Amphidinium_carterae.1